MIKKLLLILLILFVYNCKTFERDNNKSKNLYIHNKTVEGNKDAYISDDIELCKSRLKITENNYSKLISDDYDDLTDSYNECVAYTEKYEWIINLSNSIIYIIVIGLILGIIIVAVTLVKRFFL